MRLTRARVREFKSVWDSTDFEVGKVTCLVGKNEAGKTSLLQALYRLNPIVPGDAVFDVTHDYPRSDVEDYQQAVEAKRRTEAVVIDAFFELDDAEVELVEAEYGPGCLEAREVHLQRGYWKDAQLRIGVKMSKSAMVRHLVESYGLPEPLRAQALTAPSLADLSTYLETSGKAQDAAFAAAQADAINLPEADRPAALEASKGLAEVEQAKAIRARLSTLIQHKQLGGHVWDTLLKARFPRFLYFDTYYQMTGYDNVEALKKRQEENKLLPSDHPLLGLIDLARLNLDKLISPTSTQELTNKLEGASNHLSKQILTYWSQNKHLRMKFDVRPGLPGDPEGMRSGTNVWGSVVDSKHQVSTALGTRSAGFVWFFSFLSWYSAEKKKDQPLVLLLDEPGLTLHGRAQEDLLRYFETEIVPNDKHQLVYSTHSPFMVDARHFERVRIVQDDGIDSDVPLPRDRDGTRVFTDVLKAGADSLFPLQGALGYDISQTLFIGPNSLVVEGVSDLLYLQTMSGVLESKGRRGLDGRWTITPVGGSDKVPTFVALMASQQRLNVATLIDFQKGDQQTIENLYKSKLLTKSHVLTFADFTKTVEADIEDLFDESFYLKLVNDEYLSFLTAAVTVKDLSHKAPRILVRLEALLQKYPLKADVRFNHYRPARRFAESVALLTIPKSTLERFEAAFAAVNALLPP